MPGDRFDVLAYAADAQGSHRSVLLGAGEPIPDPHRDLLRYLRNRFSDTTSWLRLVLVTQTHKEPRLTAFLAAWAYECHWNADALTALLDEEPLGSGRPGLRDRFRERAAPLAEAVVANVHGESLAAVQMAERVVDAALVDRMLSAAVTRAPAGVAEDLVRIRQVLRRQRTFFVEEAAKRLAASPRARRLARARLAARAWPIGADRDRRGTAAAFAVLNATDPGWAGELDAELGQQFGLPDLHLMRSSAAHPGRPVDGPASRAFAAVARVAGRRGPRR